MTRFDISTLFDLPKQGPQEVKSDFHSASEALAQLKKWQVEEIVWPQRPLYHIVESIWWEVILRYRENWERIVAASLSYSIPRDKTQDFLKLLWQDNLPPEWTCLVIADFWNHLDISIYERNEEDWKKLVDTQWRDENIFFISHNYPKWYMK